MTVSVLDFRNENSVKRWDAFVYERSQLYHHSRWARIISLSYGFRPYYLYIEKNGEIKSVFPLFHVRLPLVRDELVSIPHLESGGIIGPEFCNLYFDFVRRNIKARKMKIYQLRDRIGDFFSNTGDVIMIKRLPGTKEEIITGIKSATTRNYMRRALEKDFEIILQNDGESPHAFYNIYLVKMREFGTPPHSIRFIEKIADEYSQEAKILLVRSAGEVVGAAWYILFNEYLYNLYLVVPRKYLRGKIVYLIQYKAMEMAIKNNLKYLVLGRSTKDSGTYFYKSELGGQPAQLYVYNFSLTGDGYEAQPEKTIKEKYKFASRLWSRFPPFLTNTVGPKIRKWVY
jgi:hypothetical protein